MAASSGRAWRLAAVVGIAAYGLGCVVTSAASGFHVGLNDFWGNLALSEQAHLSSPASLYNASYPFGYALLLHLFGAWPAIPAQLLNIALGVVLLATVWRFGSSLVGPAWALAACAIVGAWPPVFRYITTPGPDIAVASLAALGFMRLFGRDATRYPTARAVFWAGAMLGVAALFRYHGLVLAVFMIGATAIGLKHWRAHIVNAGCGLFGVYLLQMIVTMLAHHGPFHTGQALLVYKLVHGVNWFHVSDATAPASVVDVIAASPSAFINAYLRMLKPLWFLPVPALVLVFIARTARTRRFGWAALGTIVPYLIVVASGGSSRGALPVLFLVALSTAAVAAEAAATWLAHRRQPVPTRWRAAVLAVAAAALGIGLGYAWLKEDYGTLKRRGEADRMYRRIEATLRQDGALSAKQIFASDFDVYFPTMAGFTPRTNGSWLRVDGRTYNERFPELCVTTTECLLRDAKAAGITHVILTPAAFDLSAAAGALYASEDSTVVELRGREADFKIFRIR